MIKNKSTTIFHGLLVNLVHEMAGGQLVDFAVNFIALRLAIISKSIFCTKKS